MINTILEFVEESALTITVKYRRAYSNLEFTVTSNLEKTTYNDRNSALFKRFKLIIWMVKKFAKRIGGDLQTEVKDRKG